MPDSTTLSLSGANKIAALIATDLTNSVLHLYKDAVITPPPTISTPLASFTAAECNFNGYAPLTITSVGDLVQLGNAWAIVLNARFDFNPAGGSPGNQVGGWYLVSATGVLYEFGVFAPSRPAQAAGNSIFVTVVLPITAEQVA